MIKRALSLALVTIVASCTTAPLPPVAGSGPGGGPILSDSPLSLGANVEVRIDTGVGAKIRCPA